MCISKLGQVIYGVISLVAIALLLAALFTPGWRQVKGNLEKNVKDGKYEDMINMVDLFGFTCVYTNGSAAATKGSEPASDKAGGKADIEKCVKWFNNKPTWEKVVCAGMIIALAASVFAFVWNFLTFCACFCKGTIHKSLGGLAAIAAFFLCISLVVYYVYNKDSIAEMKEASVDGAKQIIEGLDGSNNVSYSFYMACGALVAQVANTVVGTLIVFFADKCL